MLQLDEPISRRIGGSLNKTLGKIESSVDTAYSDGMSKSGGSRAYAAGKSVGSLASDAAKSVGSAVGGAYGSIKPVLQSVSKPAIDAVKSRVTAHQNVTPKLVAGINAAGGSIDSISNAVSGAIDEASTGARNFGRGLIGKAPLPQNAMTGFPANEARNAANQVLPITGGGNAVAVAPSLPGLMLDNVGPKSVDIPAQVAQKPVVSPVNASIPSQPVGLRAIAPIANRQGRLFKGDGSATTIPIASGAQTLERQPAAQQGIVNLPNASDYVTKPKDLPTAVSDINPLLLDVPVNLNALSAGPFGMFPALLAAQAGLAPYAIQQAQAKQARKEALDNNDQGMDLYKADTDRALRTADIDQNERKMQADSAVAERNYKRQLRLDDTNIRKIDSEIEQDRRKASNESTRLGLDISKAELDRQKTKQAQDRLKVIDKYNQDRLVVERERAKRPVVKMQAQYKDGFKESERPIVVDPYTGQVLGVGDAEAFDFGEYGDEQYSLFDDIGSNKVAAPVNKTVADNQASDGLYLDSFVDGGMALAGATAMALAGSRAKLARPLLDRVSKLFGSSTNTSKATVAAENVAETVGVASKKPHAKPANVSAKKKKR